MAAGACDIGQLTDVSARQGGRFCPNAPAIFAARGGGILLKEKAGGMTTASDVPAETSDPMQQFVRLLGDVPDYTVFSFEYEQQVRTGRKRFRSSADGPAAGRSRGMKGLTWG